jgi:long-chain acyl-CoA synthetase
MPDALLLTGATGFLGMELLAHLADRDDRPILALVRAADEDEAEGRLAEVREAVFGDSSAHADRIRAVPGDLTKPGLDLPAARRAALAAEVGEIVHGAASVSFTDSIDAARATNVAGTRRMLELALEAHRAGGLRRYAHVSTAYVAGDRRGACSEDELDPDGRFRNAYERSKAEAEALVRSHADRLPVQVLRPGIVVGHSVTGWTSSFNVLYGPMRAFAAGALPLLPGRRAAPVDVVPVDFVASAVVALLDEPAPSGATYHLTAGPRATTVGELVDLGSERFSVRAPRPVPPWLWRRALRPALRRRGPAMRRKALDRTEVYEPYFRVRATYDTSRAEAALRRRGIAPPELRSYFDRLVDFALETRWGRRPLTRAQAHERAGLSPRPLAMA